MSKVIVATHRAYSVFVIPDEYKSLPLECFEVLRDTLCIYSEESPRKLLCEVGSSLPADETIDWVMPSDIEFDDKKNYPIEDSEDEDEEEKDKIDSSAE